MDRKDLTQGSIAGNILTFSLPYILAYFLQILYGLADLFIIGRYCNVDSTTAVSNGAQVMYLLTCTVIGLAMGTTVRTAHAIGAKDNKQASQIIGNTISLFLVLSIAMAVALLFFRDGIVSLINTPMEAVKETRAYLTVCFIGIPFIMAYNIIASIFRGLGDSKSPMYFVAIACLANILLDYFFIRHMGWGAVGAALGTTLSQMLSVAMAVMAIRRHRDIFDVKKEDLKPRRQAIAGILKIGIPIAMQDGFIQIAFIAITVIANGRGLYDAAAVGIVEKFIGLVFIVPSAMLSSISAIASQNIGARQMDRAKKTMWTAMAITTTYGVIVSVILQFIPDMAVRAFTHDAHVIALGAEYLRGYVWDCIFAGIHFCFSGFFTACGYSLISFLHNFIAIVTARIPLSYLASEMYPDTLYPMGLATCMGSVVSCLICVMAYRFSYLYMRRSGETIAAFSQKDGNRLTNSSA